MSFSKQYKINRLCQGCQTHFHWGQY